MNDNQKTLVSKWTVGYVIVIIMFAAIYYFKDPMPVILAIMMIVALFGGKRYKYDREQAERDMQEFIEYSKQHKMMLTAIAAYSAVLPILLYSLAKTNYITIGSDSKSLTIIACAFMLPFILFDIGHRVYIYKKTELSTEQQAPLDRE